MTSAVNYDLGLRSKFKLLKAKFLEKNEKLLLVVVNTSIKEIFHVSDLIFLVTQFTLMRFLTVDSF